MCGCLARGRKDPIVCVSCVHGRLILVVGHGSCRNTDSELYPVAQVSVGGVLRMVADTISTCDYRIMSASRSSIPTLQAPRAMFEMVALTYDDTKLAMRKGAARSQVTESKSTSAKPRGEMIAICCIDSAEGPRGCETQAERFCDD